MDELVLSKLNVQSLVSPSVNYTKSEQITDDGDGTRTLLASEAGTVFLIDDAALIVILPTVTQDMVGSKYKFVIAEEETTALTIKTQGNTHYLNGYAVITAGAAVPNCGLQMETQTLS